MLVMCLGYRTEVIPMLLISSDTFKYLAACSQASYEESRLNEAEVGDKKKWLKEGMDCTLLFWNGRVFLMSFSSSLRLHSLCFPVSVLSLDKEMLSFTNYCIQSMPWGNQT